MGGDVSALLGFAEPDDQYCYQATARHLLTDKTTSISGCIPASDVELFDEANALTAQRNYILNSCEVPPTGHEDEWCDTHAGKRADEGCAIQPGATSIPRWSFVGVALAVAGFVRRTRRFAS